MKVFVTGATGLIGAHTSLALLKAGHQLRLLVRDKDKAYSYFKQRGYTLDDIVVADMCDAAAMKQAIRGCDAVFHAAAMVSLDPKLAETIYASNLSSIDAVIVTAYKLGIENIIYVSSISVFFNPAVANINENSALGVLKEAYSKSKTDCEVYARELQAQGLPIQITYPSGTFSPDDPKLNESNASLLTLLRCVPIFKAGIQYIDARDLANIHCYLIEYKPTGNFQEYRFITAGNYYRWRDFQALLSKLTGRRIIALTIPVLLMRIIGKLCDWIKAVYPLQVSVTSESVAIVTQWPVASSDKVLALTGVSFRSGEETFADTIEWLAQQGHITGNLAGKLINQTR